MAPGSEDSLECSNGLELDRAMTDHRELRHPQQAATQAAARHRPTRAARSRARRLRLLALAHPVRRARARGPAGGKKREPRLTASVEPPPGS